MERHPPPLGTATHLRVAQRDCRPRLRMPAQGGICPAATLFHMHRLVQCAFDSLRARSGNRAVRLPQRPGRTHWTLEHLRSVFGPTTISSLCRSSRPAYAGAYRRPSNRPDERPMRRVPALLDTSSPAATSGYHRSRLRHDPFPTIGVSYYRRLGRQETRSVGLERHAGNSCTLHPCMPRHRGRQQRRSPFLRVR